MAKYADRVPTLRDIFEKSIEERKSLYRVDSENKHIDRVIIDGNIFTDYQAFSFLWEKSYIKSPVRSGDGTIGNLNSYATFLTPHLKIDFSLMSIDSYRILMGLIYRQNEFVVTCYDVVNNKDVTNKMYFSTEEMPKLLAIARAFNDEEYIELLGVQDYTVEMIGTNAPIDTIDILYYDNNGVLISEATQQVVSGTEVIINYDFVAPSGDRFDGVWRKENGEKINNGTAIKANVFSTETLKIKLTAEVVPTNQYTLSFSYGNGNVVYTQSAGALNSISITKNQTINSAISNANITLEDGKKFTFPTNGTGGLSVRYDENKYTVPYDFVGWYWTPEANESTKVTGESSYGYDLNRTIYQIYEPKKYQVSYQSNAENQINFDNIKVV